MGTAFVISQRYRLLASNVHLADVLAKTGAMFAIYNGARRRAKSTVSGIIPALSANTTAACWSAARTHRTVLSCRLALTSPCFIWPMGRSCHPSSPLASPHELETLFAQPVGVLGFPSFDNQRWPADGERPET